MVYGRYNYSFHGVYKPTYNWGASSCADENQTWPEPGPTRLRLGRAPKSLRRKFTRGHGFFGDDWEKVPSGND